MPALFILAVVSWLLGGGKTRRPKPGDLSLFTALDVRARRRWSPFFISLVTHVFGLGVIFIASDIFSTPDDDFLPRLMASRALLIKLPEHIYLVPTDLRSLASSTRTPKSGRVRVRRKDLRKYTEESTASKSIQAPSRLLADTQQNLLDLMPPPDLSKSELRKFELPDLPVKIAKTQTLLQAELPTDMEPPVDKRLPQLLFWDAESRLKDKPEKALQPGNLTAKTQTPRLDAIPHLQIPNHELHTAEVRISSPPELAPSALTLPSSTTMPLRVLDPPNAEPTAPASIDPFVGDPVHVLALSPDPAPLTDAFKSLFIPAGNQLARLPGTPPLFGPPGSASDSQQASVGADNPEELTASNSGAAGASDPSANADSAANPADLPPNPAELLHSFPGEGQVLGLLTPPALTAPPIRMLHPSNGVFDIVVVQSSATDAFPEGARALSGRPIYTVYLEVGAPKEWILQYCVPNAAGPTQTGGIVQLGNPTPVGAPYPLVTVRPPEEWRHGADYLLVHGFLDASGRFRDLKVLATQEHPDPSSNALLQYLTYWEFRPAIENGRPVLVEVILAVPPDRMEQAKI